MFVIPKVLTQASHLFRQDTDAYFFNVAAKYGCTTRQNWRVADLDVRRRRRTITGQNGEVFRARYLIDASGFRSPLAEKFDLRESPPRLKHHSRSLFTHYIGIKPFDEVCHYPESLRPPAERRGTAARCTTSSSAAGSGSSRSTTTRTRKNPLVQRRPDHRRAPYPKPKDMTPEQEFNHYLDKYPAVKRQFDGAKRVREWVSTDRLQYSSKQYHRRTAGA